MELIGTRYPITYWKGKVIEYFVPIQCIAILYLHNVNSYSLEISSGFGRTEDMIFRVGLLNSNATYQKVDYALNAISDALRVTCNYIPPTSAVYY